MKDASRYAKVGAIGVLETETFAGTCVSSKVTDREPDGDLFRPLCLALCCRRLDMSEAPS
eukprot:4747461-Amphidinium_carterae.1